jgi:hypothetical protein
MIYLASAYTSHLEDEKAAKRQQKKRALRAAKCCALLWEATNKPVYSPIAHGTAIEPFMSDLHVKDHSRWMRHCYQILRQCESMFLLLDNGWSESKGVGLEISFCRLNKIPFFTVELLKSNRIILQEADFL